LTTIKIQNLTAVIDFKIREKVFMPSFIFYQYFLFFLLAFSLKFSEPLVGETFYSQKLQTVETKPQLPTPPLKKDASKKSRPDKKAPWKEALAQVYKNNPEIKIAQSELRIVQDQVAAGYADLLPRVEGKLSMSRTRNHPSKGTQPTGSVKNSRDRSATLNASQSLFEGGRIYATIQKARHEEKARTNALQSKETEVLLKAFGLLLDIALAEEKVSFYAEHEKRANHLLRRAKAQEEAGEKTTIDVIICKAQFASAQAQHEKAKGELIQKKAEYQSIAGAPLKEIQWPTLDLLTPGSLEALKQEVMRQNPKIQEATNGVEAARYAVNAEIGRHLLPSVQLEGSLGRSLSEQKNFSDPNDSSAISIYTAKKIVSGAITMRIPIPLGRGQAQVRMAENNLTKARYGLKNIQLTSDQATVDLLEKIKLYQTLVKQYSLEVKAYKLSYDAIQEEISVGQKTAVEAIDIQNKWAEGKMNLLNAKKELTMCQARLAAMRGQFTARDLSLKVCYYDKESYSPFLFTGVDKAPR
jgi:outer membrane protein